MNAEQAKAIADKANEPYTLGDIHDFVSHQSRQGIYLAKFKTNRMTREVYDSLEADGYQVSETTESDGSQWAVISWR